jgi:Lrp/AsnC family leucine-responsive transcriptional regulator
MRLDDISWMLLEHLQRDARASYRELADAVGLTPPAVAERMRKMERVGIIKGYRAELDFEALGLPLVAIIRVTAQTTEAIQAVPRIAAELPEILECHRVTGAESHVLRAVVRNPAHLEELIGRLVEFGAATLTNIITSSPKSRTLVTREASLHFAG